MKFTSKKTVSEVVIDLEDGCIVKLTKHNLLNVNINKYATQFGGKWIHFSTYKIIMDNCLKLGDK